MPNTLCFSYQADPPTSGMNRGVAQPDLPGLRRMPAICFSYRAAAPLDIRNREAVQHSGYLGCFSYSVAGPDDRVVGTCVSYPVAPCFRY